MSSINIDALMHNTAIIQSNIAGYMAAVSFEILCLGLCRSARCEKHYCSSSPIKGYHKRIDKANVVAKKCRYSGKLHSVQADI
jgi:hypothetical protein